MPVNFRFGWPLQQLLSTSHPRVPEFLAMNAVAFSPPAPLEHSSWKLEAGSWTLS